MQDIVYHARICEQGKPPCNRHSGHCKAQTTIRELRWTSYYGCHYGRSATKAALLARQTFQSFGAATVAATGLIGTGDIGKFLGDMIGVWPLVWPFTGAAMVCTDTPRGDGTACLDIIRGDKSGCCEAGLGLRETIAVIGCAVMHPGENDRNRTPGAQLPARTTARMLRGAALEAALCHTTTGERVPADTLLLTDGLDEQTVVGGGSNGEADPQPCTAGTGCVAQRNPLSAHEDEDMADCGSLPKGSAVDSTAGSGTAGENKAATKPGTPW